MRKVKVLMVGPVPPPVGGVSIHLTRLAHLLSKDFDVFLLDESRQVKAGIVNIRKFPLLKYLKMMIACDIIHIHSGIRVLKYIHILLSRILGKRTIFTIHSYTATSSFWKLIDGWVYSLPHVTIAVGIEIHQRLKLTNKVVIKEAFLPPVLEKESALPAKILDWVKEKKKQGFQVAAANAWRLKSHNGVDLYGLDLCIDSAIRLRAMGRKVAFIYVISDPNGDLNVTEYVNRIKENNLEDIFYLHQSQISFIKLILETDIILRPTNTDGDALTVREGLHFNKPVVASDVTKRPEGTVLFNNRDSTSLTKAIDILSKKKRSVSLEKPDNEPENFSEFYSVLYQTA